MLYEFGKVEDYEKFINEYTTGAFSTFDMEVFIPQVKKIKEKGTYLEIGVDRGKSLLTAFLAAPEGVNVIGIDICDTDERREAFRLLGLENYISFIHGESSQVAKYWQTPIDVLFIDGNHSYEYVLSDIKNWGKFVVKGGAILFHDCDESSPGVVQATNESFPGNIQLFKTPEKNTSMAKVQL